MTDGYAHDDEGNHILPSESTRGNDNFYDQNDEEDREDILREWPRPREWLFESPSLGKFFFNELMPWNHAQDLEVNQELSDPDFPDWKLWEAQATTINADPDDFR